MKKEQLDELLKQMTLDEKVDQLVMLDNSFFKENATVTGPQVKLGLSDEVMQNIGSVYNAIGFEEARRIQEEYLKKNRLHIPLLFCGDIIYGLKTVLPIPLGFSCSFDPEMIQEGIRMVADEASAAGIHATFSPMLDLSRDPRWGRVMEGIGEDPYLAARIAEAEVKGFQGDLDEHHVLSCIKHFAAYGAPESGRDYNAVDMSERKLRQEYLRSYESAIKAGAAMVMPSFNTINGIPSTANKWLLKTVLEEEWGFEGVKVSDYAAIQELVYHGFAKDACDAAERAVHCGMHFDMKTNVYANYLKRVIEEGRVKETEVDALVLRILELKNRLGLFEDPYRGLCAEDEKKRQGTLENRQIAKKLADESIVLLENKNNVLPLDSGKKIALIGPMADTKSVLGMWAFHSDQSSVCTLRDALVERVGEESVLYAMGCDSVDSLDMLGDIGMFFKSEVHVDVEEEYKKAMQVAQEADVIVFTMGEHIMQSGEASSRTDLSLAKCQMRLLEGLRQLDKPIIVPVYSGRPLLLKEVAENCDALLQVYWPGTMGNASLADILIGKVNPSGKLSMSVPRNMGQIPVYYSQLKTGRPMVGSGHTGKFVSKYLDCPNAPLYGFGYGLSYTQFEITKLSVLDSQMSKDKPLQVFVHVKNTGERNGDTVVQLYIHDQAGTVARPLKELIDFKRVHVDAGEELEVKFVVSEEKVRYYDENMKFVTEPGKFTLYAGLSSEDGRAMEFEYKE